MAQPRKAIGFELLATGLEDAPRARRGRFRTEHGSVETPAFMPVGTQGAVKAATPDQVAATGAEVVLANTFHLSLEDRTALVERAGGLHSFMGWERTILTDSGGFQVFSLPGKKVDDEGVDFVYGKDKKRYRLTPESSMRIQRALGADIVMAFDECVEYPASEARVAESLVRTHDWERRCRECELAPHQFLFGIVQGGTYPRQRTESARVLKEIPFDGFAIGGVSVGEGHDLMMEVTRHTAPLLPEGLPRYLMGVGTPRDIWGAVAEGVDMFDCVIPTRYARNGTLFTRVGQIRIGDKRFRKDRLPIDTKCTCYACSKWSRMVLRHLFYAGEQLYHTLATIHNLHFYQDLMRSIREALDSGRFATRQKEWTERYEGARG